jgi:hypothetical protein
LYQTEMTDDSWTIVKAYLVCTHNMAGLPKTGDKLLELVRSDIQYMRLFRREDHCLVYR